MMSAVEELLALPPGEYFISFEGVGYNRHVQEMHERGAIYVRFRQDNAIVPDDEEQLRGKAIILDGYHDYSCCIHWYLIGLGCRLYRLITFGRSDYHIEGDTLIASTDPPPHIPINIELIDESIKQASNDITNLQEILRKLEDLRFTAAKKSPAKKPCVDQ